MWKEKSPNLSDSVFRFLLGILEIVNKAQKKLATTIPGRNAHMPAPAPTFSVS